VKLDEATLSESLHDATRDLAMPGDIGQVARRGGARRLRRRQIAAVLCTAAVVAALVPTAIALAPSGSPQAGTHVGHNSNGDLYAAPPTVSTCGAIGGNGSGAASATTYPELLMLPRDTAVRYAFANKRGVGAGDGCPPPHVALTLTKASGDKTVAGAVIYGPDAPSAVQAGEVAPHETFSGLTLHPSVDGVTGIAFYIAANKSTRAYWTDPDGGQWRTQIRGLTSRQVKSLLASLQFDAAAGTAKLPDATSQGWTVQPAAPDRSGRQPGIFYVLWHVDRTRVAMTVTHGPDRIEQVAALAPGAQSTIIRGRPAVVYRHGGNLRWQPAKDISIYLTAYGSSPSQIVQIANSLQSISPEDPRLFRP
jgi:hypothetical protein